jgi:SAM-dependent methyltransferase
VNELPPPLMSTVIWHDLECGTYTEDLPLWLGLAAEFGGPILDVGAGSGRVTLALARFGHPVLALDSDAELLEALEGRARTEALAVSTVHADARGAQLAEPVPLAIVPMQTIQLLGRGPGRARFFATMHANLQPGGALAVAFSETVEEFEWRDGDPFPLPDIVEHDGTVYSSQPTAVRSAGDSFVLERKREMIGPNGERSIEEDVIVLDVLDASLLITEAESAGFRCSAQRSVAPTSEHVGSEVLIFTSASSGPRQTGRAQ